LEDKLAASILLLVLQVKGFVKEGSLPASVGWGVKIQVWLGVHPSTEAGTLMPALWTRLLLLLSLAPTKDLVLVGGRFSCVGIKHGLLQGCYSSLAEATDKHEEKIWCHHKQDPSYHHRMPAKPLCVCVCVFGIM
jgi:hypothetical protein